MADFSYNELASAAGQDTGNLVLNAANKGADFVCALYRDYPGAIIQSPVGSFVEGLWDTLCKSRAPGLPPQPAPPFTGGQCPVQYVCQVYYKLTNPADGYIEQGTTQVGADFGPIKGLGRRSSPTHPGMFELGIICTKLNGSENFSVFYRGNPAARTLIEQKFVSIARVDGQPDNCGNVGAAYPPSVIPPARLQGTTTIIQNNGKNVTLPIVYAPITGRLPINVDVGGIPLKFDLDGVDVMPEDDVMSRQDMLDRLQDLEDMLADIYDNGVKVLGELDEVVPDVLGDDYDLEELGEDDPQEKDGINDLEYVQITLTSIPGNIKTQSGNQADNIIYAGWLQFRSAGFNHPRQPIHFEKGIFRAPPGADGFAFTFYKGVRGEAVVFKKKLEVA